MRKILSEKTTLMLLAAVLIASFIIVKITLSSVSPKHVGIVKKEGISDNIIQHGVVTPQDKEEIFTPVNGTIEQIYVKEGDEVEEYAPLVKVKNGASEEQKQSAYAIYSNAINSAAILEQNNQRLSDIVKDMDKQSAQARDLLKIDKAAGYYQTVMQQHDSLNSALAEARRQENIARMAYESTQDAIIYSHLPGKIAELNVRLKDIVLKKSDAQLLQPVDEEKTIINNEMHAQLPIVVIGNYGKLCINIVLPETQAKSLKTGQEVQILFDEFFPEEIKGEIIKIDSALPDNYGFLIQNVYIGFDIEDPAIKPGTKATVFIENNYLSNILSVPTSAIRYKGDRSFLEILPGNNPFKTSLIPVETGIKGIYKIEITKGVREGTRIIIE